MNKFEKPEYTITIGSAFFSIIKKRDKDTITYGEISDIPSVLEVPVIKEITISRILAELEIYASGEVYDYLNQTSGGDIGLKAVALPSKLVNAIEGAFERDGFTINKTNDVSREFAFGYWSENSDGSYVYYWHPLCKLVPSDEKHATRKKDLTEPEADYRIKVLPYNDLWRVKYSTKGIETALTREEFFEKPIYAESQLDLLLAL